MKNRAAQGILLAWAYGEAIMDIRTLISGGKVPLVKNAEDWKLSLSGLMQLGSAGENVAAVVKIWKADLLIGNTFACCCS